jgi:CYTH domain-containing protein
MQAGKYARYEFERRFLVRRLPPGLDTAPGFRILDRYLTGTRLRLRRMEPLDDGEPVLKLGQKQTPNAADATTAVITTIYLSQAEYDALAGLAGDELAKIRHGVDDGGRSWSIDVFGGALDGLVLAEVEYPDAEVMAAHGELPGWVGADVSDDPSLTGAALARLSPAEAAQLIDRL